MIDCAINDFTKYNCAAILYTKESDKQSFENSLVCKDVGIVCYAYPFEFNQSLNIRKF